MVKVVIKGAIVSNNDKSVYDYFGMDATSPKDVKSIIDGANGEALEVEINSGGGSVFDGSEIYTALKEYKGNVVIKITGLAASAASVIAMAGNKVMMSPTSQMMIHNVSAGAGGDYRDMSHMADILKNANKSIANAYKLKSGMEEQTLLDMMDKETWLTSDQALEHGLIDEVMFSEGVTMAANFNSLDGTLPSAVINKVRNEIHLSKSDDVDIFMQQKAQMNLKLLKLKGITV